MVVRQDAQGGRDQGRRTEVQIGGNETYISLCAAVIGRERPWAVKRRFGGVFARDATFKFLKPPSSTYHTHLPARTCQMRPIAPNVNRISRNAWPPTLVKFRNI